VAEQVENVDEVKQANEENQLKSLRDRVKNLDKDCDVCNSRKAVDSLGEKLRVDDVSDICTHCAFQINHEFKEIQRRQAMDRDDQIREFIRGLANSFPKVVEKDLLENDG